MADWDTVDLELTGSQGDRVELNGHVNPSLEDTESNRSISSTKDNCPSDGSSDKDVVLTGGNVLKEESMTEGRKEGRMNLEESGDRSPQSEMTSLTLPPKPVFPSSGSTGGTAKSRAAKSPHAAGSTDSIPIEEITIPKDANISTYSVNELATFLRYLNIEDRIVAHLHRKNVDGKRFSRLKDAELESLGMLKNPVVLFFRERSSQKPSKKKQAFML